MPTRSSSVSPLAFPTGEKAHMPVVQSEGLRQPRKVLQPKRPESDERPTSNLNKDSGSVNSSNGQAQNGPLGPKSLVNFQDGVRDAQVPEDEEHRQPITGTPETIHYSLEPDADFKISDSEVEKTDHTITYVSTTTTKVEQRETTDGQKAEQTAATFLSQTITGQKDGTQSSARSNTPRNASSCQEKRFPLVTETGQSPITFSSTSQTLETRRFEVPSVSVHSVVQEKFVRIEHSRREEMDHIVSLMGLMTTEYDEYKRSCEMRFNVYEAEKRRLLQENAASAAHITLLNIQLSSRRDSYPETVSQHERLVPTITMITTTITTVTTRIEQWKHKIDNNTGPITISSKELEQLSSDLSTTASQMNELQQQYMELSKHFTSVRHELQLALLLRDEKDRTIASLTAEIDQWKHADGERADQTTAVRRDNEALRRELSAASSRATELQQRCDAQSTDLGHARNELQTRSSSIEERDRAVASITAEVARWKQSDATKAEQIATIRRDYEQLQGNFSALSSQSSELQKRYDIQTKEIRLVRNDLQAHKSLVEEKDRAITALTAEVDEWKRTDTAKEGQITAEHRDKVKLQQDLATFSSQTTELRERCDVQSKDIAVIRSELQAKISLLQEKENIIASLTAEVAEGKREDSGKADLILAARRDVEQLRGELSSASSRFADIQKRYEAQSRELNSVRDELHQIELLYGADSGLDELSEHAVAQQISRALELKNKEMEELRRDLAQYTTRNTELQESYESLSRDLRTVRDELQAKTSQSEGTITSLTTQVEQWKRSDATKGEQLATALEQVEKHQHDLSTSTSQLAELQRRYEVQSGELIAVRKDFQAKTTSNESKDRTIASLSAEADQWKRSDTSKVEQIATTLKKVEKLQKEISTSTSKLADLQGRYDAQSREFSSVREALQAKTSLYESEVHTSGSLTAELEQWKRADATKAEQITIITKQVEEHKLKLSTSASQLAQLQGRYDAQSEDLVSVRNELHSRTSSNEDKNRIVAILTAQVEEWKRTDALKEERIAATRNQAEALQRDLNKSSSHVAELQKQYEAQSRELSSLRDQLQDTKDHTVSSLISQVEEWKRSDGTKGQELMTTRRDLEQVRHDLATSSSQIEHWQRGDAARTEELTATRKDLEKLRRDLSASSSQIREYQQRSVSQSAELTSQIEKWKHSDTAKAEELAAAREKLEQLQHSLSTSSSQITEFQQRCEAQSTELRSLREQLRATSTASGDKEQVVASLNAQVEQWKRADASKAEELTRARGDLSTSSSRITEFQQRCESQTTELSALREQLQATLSAGGDKKQAVVTLNAQIEQWKRADAAKAEELTRTRGELEILQRKLSSVVSKETKEVYEKVTSQVKDYDAIIKLSTKVDEWLHADAKKAEELALVLAKRNKENEELRSDLVTLKEMYIRAPELKQIFQSQTIEIQQRYEEQSRRLEVALAERQSQLDGVQRFVTTADTYADTAIVQMLQKLNAEVQQSTTLMAEYIVETFPSRTTKPTKDQTSAARKVSQSIGQTLVGCLGKEELDDVALYLPIAFQAHLMYYLRWMISSWTIEKGYNDHIKKIYDQLQKSEAQTISGRWRSLTRTYISPTCLSDPNTLISDTIQGLFDIVVAAGFAPLSPSAKSKVLSKFGDKVSAIISTAGRFSKMIGEVVSADFEVLAVSPLEEFEEATMEEDVDDYDKNQGGGTLAGQKVLCSTHLGMTKRMQLESGNRDTLTVIKAKVILESFLDG